MTSRGTTHRTVRIDDELWEAAKVKAAEEDANLSEVIRDALRAYVEDWRPTGLLAQVPIFIKPPSQGKLSTEWQVPHG